MTTVLQTIKDVNQALVDDALVDCDKIGSGNYFWSFPSKLSQARKRKLGDLEQRKAAAHEKLAKVRQSIDEQKSRRTDSVSRRGTELCCCCSALGRSLLTRIICRTAPRTPGRPHAEAAAPGGAADEREGSKGAGPALGRERPGGPPAARYTVASSEVVCVTQSISRAAVGWLVCAENSVQIAKLGADRWTGACVVGGVSGEIDPAQLLIVWWRRQCVHDALVGREQARMRVVGGAWVCLARALLGTRGLIDERVLSVSDAQGGQVARHQGRLRLRRVDVDDRLDE